MKIKHELAKSVKAYLLGSLSDEASNEIEARYFADPEFLEAVQGLEHDLIVDYLDGRLGQTEHVSFEQRYLQVPALRQKLEDVRREHASPRQSQGSVLRYAWAAAFATVLVVCVWIAAVSRPSRFSGGSVPTEATLLLTPGVAMAADSHMAELEQPPPGASVRLQLEYPGGATSAPVVTIRISRLDDSGSSRIVWKSEPVSGSGKENPNFVYTGVVDSKLLTVGDYLAELVGPDSQRIEAYLFRVRSSSR